MQPPSPRFTPTSLLGTPQGQLLLSLGAPQGGGQRAAASERGVWCVCGWKRAQQGAVTGPPVCDGICSVSQTVCSVSPPSPIVSDHHFFFLVGNHRSFFFWVQGCASLLSLPVIPVPAFSNCAIFSGTLLSPALSPQLLQGRV